MALDSGNMWAFSISLRCVSSMNCCKMSFVDNLFLSLGWLIGICAAFD